MKLPFSAWLFIAVILVAIGLIAGCVTTVAPDGTKITRADGELLRGAANTALDAYTIYRGSPVHVDGKSIKPVVR